MHPRLIVISGHLEGMDFPVTKAETSVGRDPDNDICLKDISISRRHCSIRQSADGYLLIDHKSRNASIVNGMPVEQHLLRSGDRIRIGDSLVLFLNEPEKRRESARLVQFDDARIITRNTVLLRRTDGADAAIASRSTRDLNALLKISLAINSFRDSGALLDHLLELIGSVIPAERGAILLAEDGPADVARLDGLAPASGWQRTSSSGASNRLISVSRTVTERVRREGISLLSNDVLHDFDMTAARSLAMRSIRALMAAPLSSGEAVQGVIYLDSDDPSAEFDEDHLQLLSAIAGLASVAIENLHRVARLEDENQRLRAEMSIEHDMIGDSARIRDVYQFISKVAPTEATVLIRGESGTGKELAARAIHSNSQRASEPFVAINCAALTETLLESELFGHEKGAFTGATAQKKGKLEVAQGGTVFLDEIGEMALSLQAKLLRVLQEHELERVGGTRTIKVDLRVIAATNRNLEQAIKDGRFREDLYYRLNVICLTMPPLRERREDIPALVRYFASKYAQKCKRRVGEIAPEAMACLKSYDWPGNVREFENAMERAVVLGSSDTIKLEDLPELVIGSGPLSPESFFQTSGGTVRLTFYQALNEAKKRLIVDAVDKAQGSYTEAAKRLGMHPNHLHRLIRNLNMKSELKRKE